MSDLHCTLGEMAAETLGELAFLFADVVPARALESDGAEELLVRFSGARQGRLVLRAEPDLLPVLSANMLGEDAPTTKEVQRDALGELANIVCGNLLPLLTDPSNLLMLEAPTTGRDVAVCASGELLAALVTLETEAGALELRLILAQQTCEAPI